MIKFEGYIYLSIFEMRWKFCLNATWCLQKLFCVVILVNHSKLWSLKNSRCFALIEKDLHIIVIFGHSWILPKVFLYSSIRNFQFKI